MTERAQKVWEAFWENTDYPENIDGWNLSNAIRAIVSDYETWEDGTYMVKSKDILEIATELEAL
jgi:hypothetical protein